MDDITYKLKQVQIHRLNIKLLKERDLKNHYFKTYEYDKAWECKNTCKKIQSNIIKLTSDIGMKKYRFYKEHSGRWFIDIPNYIGSKDDLELVMGADSMLDLVSEGEDEIVMYLSDKQFNKSECLSFVSNAIDIGEGSYYKLNTYKGFNIDFDIWLCDVTKVVFGYFPINIYFNVII